MGVINPIDWVLLRNVEPVNLMMDAQREFSFFVGPESAASQSSIANVNESGTYIKPEVTSYDWRAPSHFKHSDPRHEITRLYPPELSLMCRAIGKSTRHRGMGGGGGVKQKDFSHAYI